MLTGTKLAALYSATKSLQNSCTAKLQLFSSILEAKQQLNSSCSGMQKCCAAFEALGSCFAVQLLTLKCCEVAAVTLQFSFGRSESATFLSVTNMNRQKSLATGYGFYNEKTLTVPLKNVSKLVGREDYLLNKPANSMLLSINFIPRLASVGMLSLIPWRHSRS